MRALDCSAKLEDYTFEGVTLFKSNINRIAKIKRISIN